MSPIQRRAIAMAYLPRAFLCAQGIYFFIVAWSFEGDERWFTADQVWWASNVNAFIAAGVANLVVVFVMRRHALLWLPMLVLVGLATLCRGFDVVFGDGDTGAKLRALGWGLQWFAAVVCVTQIIGAEIIRSTRPWTS